MLWLGGLLIEIAVILPWMPEALITLFHRAQSCHSGIARQSFSRAIG